MLAGVAGVWLAGNLGNVISRRSVPKSGVRTEKGAGGAEEQETLVRSQVFPRTTAVFV